MKVATKYKLPLPHMYQEVEVVNWQVDNFQELVDMIGETEAIEYKHLDPGVHIVRNAAKEVVLYFPSKVPSRMNINQYILHMEGQRAMAHLRKLQNAFNDKDGVYKQVQKYREIKPISYAVEWTGANLVEVMGMIPCRLNDELVKYSIDAEHDNRLWITTSFKDILVGVGDMIIKDFENKIICMRKDIFLEAYELEEEV